MSRHEYLEVLRRSFASRYRSQQDVWTGEAELARAAQLLLRHLPRRRGLRVLDVGAGGGRDAALFLGAGHRYTGLDLVEHPAWAAIRERWGAAAEFYATPLLDWAPGARACFDGVLDNGCFHHQHPAEYEAYLGHVARLLKPGGVLALSVFTPADPAAAAGHTTTIDGGRLSRYFTPAELRRLLEACGFEWREGVRVPRTLFPNHYLQAAASKRGCHGS